MVVRPIPLKKIRNAVIVLSSLLLSGGIGYWFGQNRLKIELDEFPKKPKVTVVNKAAPPERRLIDFSLFWQVWEELERSYLDPSLIDPENMVYGAISGMTSSLGDPYTVFLAPDENKQTKENLSGSFFGVGIQIGFKDHQLAVIAPIKDMPAEQAGIKAGDIILRIIDRGKGVDQNTDGLPLPEAVSLIRGDRGTQVTLQIFREGIEEPFDVSIVRKEIVIPSVEIEFIPVEGRDKSVAHLKLTQFGERTLGEWDEAVDKILSERGQIVGIILDMRNNPGGYLSGSVDIAGEFLVDGTVVVQQGRARSETFKVQKPGRLVGIPLVVLVNGGSASASEIVAGALRDRLGVVLVGEQTFGKGTVQEAVELSGGAGLHVTTSKWILPSGQEINDKGLTPDLTVSLEEEGEGKDEVDEQLEKAVEILME
jgi:carboxyl-terminal processing protease